MKVPGLIRFFLQGSRRAEELLLTITVTAGGAETAATAKPNIESSRVEHFAVVDDGKPCKQVVSCIRATTLNKLVAKWVNVNGKTWWDIFRYKLLWMWNRLWRKPLFQQVGLFSNQNSRGKEKNINLTTRCDGDDVERITRC